MSGFYYHSFIKFSTSFSNCLTTRWFMKSKFPFGRKRLRIRAILSLLSLASEGWFITRTCSCINRIRIFSTFSARSLFSDFSQTRVNPELPAPNQRAILSTVKGLPSGSLIQPNSKSGSVSSFPMRWISSSTARDWTALRNWYSEWT